MMFKVLCLCLCALALSINNFAQTPKMAKPDSQIEKEIRQLESDIFAAIQQKDAKQLETILAEDFVYRSPQEGDMAKPEFLAGVKTIPVELVALWSDDMKVNVYGEVAVIIGTQKARTRDATGKETLSATAFTDIFVRRAGKWWLVLAHGIELPTVPTSK